MLEQHAIDAEQIAGQLPPTLAVDLTNEARAIAEKAAWLRRLDALKLLLGLLEEQTEAALRAIPLDPRELPPVAEGEYLDAARAGQILGVTQAQLVLLYQQGLIETAYYGAAVEYRSLAEFCDRLREEHFIKRRRARSCGHLSRNRDAELLPFSLADTIGAKEAATLLRSAPCRRARRGSPIKVLIESRCFEAYRLDRGSPWRISRSSLMAYIERAKSATRVQRSQQRPDAPIERKQGGKPCR